MIKDQRELSLEIETRQILITLVGLLVLALSFSLMEASARRSAQKRAQAEISQVEVVVPASAPLSAETPRTF